jgi:hypothetical protein
MRTEASQSQGRRCGVCRHEHLVGPAGKVVCGGESGFCYCAAAEDGIPAPAFLPPAPELSWARCLSKPGCELGQGHGGKCGKAPPAPCAKGCGKQAHPGWVTCGTLECAHAPAPFTALPGHRAGCTCQQCDQANPAPAAQASSDAALAHALAQPPAGGTTFSTATLTAIARRQQQDWGTLHGRVLADEDVAQIAESYVSSFREALTSEVPEIVGELVEEIVTLALKRASILAHSQSFEYLAAIARESAHAAMKGEVQIVPAPEIGSRWVVDRPHPQVPVRATVTATRPGTFPMVLWAAPDPAEPGKGLAGETPLASWHRLAKRIGGGK